MDYLKQNTYTYNKISKDFSKRNYKNFWVKELALFKKLTKGNKVIDLGCGAGRDAIEFLKNKFNYTGLDTSIEMLKVAKSRAPKGKFIKGNFCKTKFKNNEFDCFWASASFLHVPKNKINIPLKEAFRITKPGGIGFISLKQKKLVNQALVKETRYKGLKRFFSFYTITEFKKILAKNKYKVVKTFKHKEKDIQTDWLCFLIKKI